LDVTVFLFERVDVRPQRRVQVSCGAQNETHTCGGSTINKVFRKIEN